MFTLFNKSILINKIILVLTPPNQVVEIQNFNVTGEYYEDSIRKTETFTELLKNIVETQVICTKTFQLKQGHMPQIFKSQSSSILKNR